MAYDGIGTVTVWLMGGQNLPPRHPGLAFEALIYRNFRYGTILASW